MIGRFAAGYVGFLVLAGAFILLGTRVLPRLPESALEYLYYVESAGDIIEQKRAVTVPVVFSSYVFLFSFLGHIPVWLKGRRGQRRAARSKDPSETAWWL